MAILKLTTNQTYELSLKYKSGKEVISKYGPQHQFTLTDGQILYLPVEVSQSIAELNLAPQEPFLLTKLSTANKITWAVERKPQPVARPQLVPADKSNVRPKSKEELLTEFGELLVSGADIAPKVNGNGHSALHMALRMVIDEAAEAEKYAAEKGLSFRFGGEDIRAMVITICIGQQQRVAR